MTAAPPPIENPGHEASPPDGTAAPRPGGWRNGPAWRAGRWVAGALALAALGTGYVWLDGQVGPPGDGDGASAPLAAESAAPTTAPQYGYPERPTLDDPFAGSPAKQWAEGAEGIVLPEAEAVGRTSKETIASSLVLTKEFLVASHLDREVLRGGHPEDALALIDPLQEDVLDGMRRALENPTEEDNPVWWFPRFDPDEVELAGEVIKVRGRMTVEEGDDGSAVIRADYSFVYPVTKADPPHAVDRSLVRRVLEVHVGELGEWTGTEGRLWILYDIADITNSRCDAAPGYIEPEFTWYGEGDQAEPGDELTDPYDRRGDLEDRPDECGFARRV
ncbi:hypothetical protein [Streptomyces sp. JJ38]|uniref:hypothetical protein n=1 Tax=Streptomyces sp. JJ38 TaxID=2738128 RepID=UPI001C575CE9|nr:hypothetical protein [Streptomyces sp. JJ38]MBW1599063.1 hypothetical protein [Streptomyces sp. JJ38]